MITLPMSLKMRLAYSIFAIVLCLPALPVFPDVIQGEVDLKSSVVTAGQRAWTMWTLKATPAPVAIPSHAVLTYDVYLTPTSVNRSGGIDIDGGTCTGLRDDARIVDQAGEGVRGGPVEVAHSGQWYTRRFDLSPYEGKTFTRIRYFSSEILSRVAGTYEAKVLNVRIVDGAGATVISYNPAPGAAPLAAVSNMVIEVAADVAKSQVASVHASVLKPGAMSCAMWTLTVLDTPVVLPEHAALVYDINVAPTSIGRNGGVELEGGTMPAGFRDNVRIVDQAGESLRGDVTQASNAGAWYTRSFDLSSLAGKSFTTVKLFSKEMDAKAEGTYDAQVRRIRLVDQDGRLIRGLQPTATTGFHAVTNNMAVDDAAPYAKAANTQPTNRPHSMPILNANARLILPSPWGSDGVTPQPQRLPADNRVVTLSVEVGAPGTRTLISADYLRFDRLQIIPPGAALEYDMLIDPLSISDAGGVDLESVPRKWFTLRDSPNMVDQFGMPAHPANRVPQAVGAWTHRRLSLDGVAGKPFSAVFLSAEFNPSKVGTYRASYRDIRIVDESGDVYWQLAPKLGDFGASVPVEAVGAATITATGTVGVTLEPARYELDPASPGSLAVSLHNYDSTTPHTVSLSSLRLEGATKSTAIGTSISVTLPPLASKTVVVPLPANLPTGNYVAKAKLTSAGQAAPVASYAISVRPPPTSAADYLGKGQFAWGADIQTFAGSSMLAELRQHGGNFVNVFVPWDCVETAPGHYDFSYIDKMLAASSKANLHAQIVFITAEKEYPAWLRPEAMLDQNGKPGAIFALSYYAPTGRPAYMRLIDAVTKRYRDNSTVVSYTFVAGGWNDGFFYRPSRTVPGLYDYSPWSQVAFRGYVRDVLGLTLAQASQRYRTNLASWDNLAQPVYAGTIDLRPIWWDFQNFRCWTVENMWSDVCQAIRKGDPKKRIELLYGGDQYATGQIANDYDAGARIARKYRAVIHNTCYEGYTAAPLVGTYTREWGIKHTCETAGTPAELPNHQQGMFNVLKYGAKGYCWIGGRPFGFYPSYAKLRPVATELSDAHPIGKRVGVLQSVSAVQCDLSGASLRGFASTYQFVNDASLTADLYTDRSFLADGHKLDPAETPVLIDSAATVLAAQAADAIAAYVGSDGEAILHASSGRFTAGNEAERYRLLSSLGYVRDSDLADGARNAIATIRRAMSSSTTRTRDRSRPSYRRLVFRATYAPTTLPVANRLVWHQVSNGQKVWRFGFNPTKSPRSPSIPLKRHREPSNRSTIPTPKKARH